MAVKKARRKGWVNPITKPDLEKRARLLALKREKKTQVEIARELGITPQSVSGMLKRIFGPMADQILEDAFELRREQILGLRAMIRVAVSRALRGELPAMDRAERLYNRLSKVAGLDAPVKNEHTGKDGAPLVNFDVDFSRLSNDQLERILRGDVSAIAPAASASGAGDPQAQAQPGEPFGVRPAGDLAVAEPGASEAAHRID